MTFKRPKVQQVAGRGNNPAGPVVSAAVLEAQAALMARRAALGIVTQPAAALDQFDHVAASTVEDDRTGRVAVGVQTLDLFTGAGTLPQAAESGTYGSGTIGRVEDDPVGDIGAKTLNQGGALAGVEATVYPSLAAAVLSSDLSAAGRLWFLLRAWDDRGRGFYDLDQLYRTFSGKGSPWRVGCRRTVQQLIKRGAGVFWTLRNRRGGRFTALQMTGPAGVALALGVSHLAGSPVAIPVSDLLGGMHRANAALFSAALALRADDHGGRPTSRATLKDLTGAAISTQQTYIKSTGVKARANYVTMSAGDVDRPGVFVYRGRIDGRPGRAILARRLPNSHDPQLTARPPGRVKKVNRTLNLVTNGARGETSKVDRIYHDTAAAAWGAWSRAYNHDHYWPCGHTAAGAALWGMVEAVNQ